MAFHAGGDISARWFDLCVLIGDEAYRNRFGSSPSELQQSVFWLESRGIKLADLEVAIEPTGRYGEVIAEFFHSHGSRVLLVQPYAFSRYAESINMRGTSDVKAAYALALYCRERGKMLKEWRPKTNPEWELRDTQLLVRSLTKRSVTIRCQLKCRLRSEFVEAELQDELAHCEQRLEAALSHAVAVIRQHPILAKDFELLLTIPGIGEKSAALLLTLIDFRQFKSSRALVCFLGLGTRKKESGSSVRGKERISKRGSPIVRGQLFMPARTARVHNPLLSEFAGRLQHNGKHDWTIQMAVIRKLVTTAWALIVRQVEFDASYVNPHQPALAM